MADNDEAAQLRQKIAEAQLQYAEAQRQIALRDAEIARLTALKAALATPAPLPPTTPESTTAAAPETLSHDYVVSLLVNAILLSINES